MVAHPRQLTDARDLRALAHPVRLSILERLVVRGPLTATGIADLIDETPANCSWHLRKLAEHGFVEESGGGRGRERPWRATSLGMTWGDGEGAAPELQVAGEALSQILVEREVARFAETRARLRGDDPEWQAATDATLTMAWLTAAELDELNEELREVAMRWFDRHEDAGKRPPGSRLCVLVAWGAPTYGLVDATPVDVSTEGAR